jgi:hypothetical protein
MQSTTNNMIFASNEFTKQSMKKKLISIMLTLTLAITSNSIYSQKDTNFGSGLKHKINENGNQSIYIDQVGFQLKSPQRSVMWSQPERISDYINLDSSDPSIAMGPDGTIHVVFSETVYPYVQRIVYRSKSSNGSWSEPLIVDAFSGVPPGSNHEPIITVSDDGDIHIVFLHWAGDGSQRSNIAYSKYNSQTHNWTTEIISGDSGTIPLSNYYLPKIIIVSGAPVVIWGGDDRNGTKEIYVVYQKDQEWTGPLLVSSIESNKAYWPKIVQMSPDSVFIAFNEHSITQDSNAIYYRILRISDGYLSEIFKIKDTERCVNCKLWFDLCSLNDREIFITISIVDTLCTYNYNIFNQTITKNPEVIITNQSNYTDSHGPSICADSYNRVHIVYNVWNIFNLYYVTYKNNEGFSQPISITTNSTTWYLPQVIYGTDGYLHVVYADNLLDTIDDNVFAREIFYTKEDISSGIELFEDIGSISFYPNPTNNNLVVNSSDMISEIIIIDITGNIIDRYTDVNNKDVTINVSSKTNGIYFFKVVTDKTIFTKKIIIN